MFLWQRIYGSLAGKEPKPILKLGEAADILEKEAAKYRSYMPPPTIMFIRLAAYTYSRYTATAVIAMP